MKKFKNISKTLYLSLVLTSLFQAYSFAGSPGSVEAIDSASADRRNIIGIEISTATDEQKAMTGCTEGGVYVSAVIPKHPADIAGLKVGDIIREIDSTPVKDMSEALMAMDGLDAGRKYPFKVCRKTQEGTVTLEIFILIEQVQERAIGKIS
jgi:C-terminal processing protease CtpA/Prc